jgi:hypothetical protein
MTLPNLRPSSRTFTPGDYPVKLFRSQNGAEARILYGNKRIGGTLELTYQNISDSDADSFLSGYDTAKGTFASFDLPENARAGWTGSSSFFVPQAGLRYRYAESPDIASVKPGRSTVTVRLIVTTS